jgi:predicted dithiol-disulfide oxidoreductase (DUF899 family)
MSAAARDRLHPHEPRGPDRLDHICRHPAQHDRGRPHVLELRPRFAFVSQAPLEKLQEYKRRMGWGFPWVSSAPGDFNFDLGFSHTEEQGREAVASMMGGGGLPPIVAQNARSSGTDVAGYLTESPGSVRSYTTTPPSTTRTQPLGVGLEFVMSYYPILDHAPKGRDEGEAWQLWIRRHDEYGGE